MRNIIIQVPSIQIHAPTFHVLQVMRTLKKPWACWHKFTMSCAVISPMDSTINPWTYASRCSPTLGGCT